MMKPLHRQHSELLTPPEVARLLGISPERVRQFCRDGRLGRRLGVNRYVIDAQELARFRRSRARPADDASIPSSSIGGSNSATPPRLA